MTFRNGKRAAMALAAALSMAASGRGWATETVAASPSLVILHPGQSVADALRGQGLLARETALHAAWLKAGHGDVSPEAKQALALTSGLVLSNTLEVGNAFAFPAISFGFKAGTPGFSYAQFEFTSAAGPTPLTISYQVPNYATKGTASFAYPAALPFYLAPGPWTLSSATIFDNAGTSVVYDASQLAAIFSANSFTVVNNGLVDAQPPVLGVGHIASTTVSLSSKFPQMKATLPVTDHLSGVTQALIFLQPPGQTYSQAEIVTIPFPVKSGTVSILNDFFPGSPTGTWLITEYSVCDAAHNCATSSDPQAIFNLFGANSITVTN